MSFSKIISSFLDSTLRPSSRSTYRNNLSRDRHTTPHHGLNVHCIIIICAGIVLQPLNIIHRSFYCQTSSLLPCAPTHYQPTLSLTLTVCLLLRDPCITTTIPFILSAQNGLLLSSSTVPAPTLIKRRIYDFFYSLLLITLPLSQWNTLSFILHHKRCLGFATVNCTTHHPSSQWEPALCSSRSSRYLPPTILSSPTHRLSSDET